MASCVLLVFVKGAVADALNGHPCTIFNRSSEKFSRFVHGVQNIVCRFTLGPEACLHHDSGLYIMASRRRDGGVHGKHRGSRYCLLSLRQQVTVVHLGITPPGRRQRTESIEAVGTAFHRYDSGSHIVQSSAPLDGGSA